MTLIQGAEPKIAHHIAFAFAGIRNRGTVDRVTLNHCPNSKITPETLNGGDAGSCADNAPSLLRMSELRLSPFWLG